MDTISKHLMPAFVFAVSCFAFVGTAHAYTPMWLACEGQKVTTTIDNGKPQSATAPIQEFYVYDDDGKNLYRYAEARKTEDIEPVLSYTPKEIRWGDVPASGKAYYPRWEGMLDRGTLKMTLDYQDGDTTIKWTQQCKPTNPQH